jgi:hypothetical protein
MARGCPTRRRGRARPSRLKSREYPMSDQCAPQPGPDRDASHPRPLPSRKSASARIKGLCHLVEKLIRLVPRVLPVIGSPPSVPVMSDHLRRHVVDKLMAQLTLSRDAWDGLCKALPDLDCKLRLLQRAIDDLGRRFDEEDREHQVEGNKLAQAYEDQVARGVENPRGSSGIPGWWFQRCHLKGKLGSRDGPP